MPYIYISAATLERKPKVGTSDYVALVQHYAHAPNTSLWREGKAVLNNRDIVRGTAIATFVKGRYLSHRHGNHAAFFLRHDAPRRGFWVIDQWDEFCSWPWREAVYFRTGHQGTGNQEERRRLVRQGQRRCEGILNH